MSSPTLNSARNSIAVTRGHTMKHHEQRFRVDVFVQRLTRAKSKIVSIFPFDTNFVINAHARQLNIIALVLNRCTVIRFIIVEARSLGPR